MGKQSRIKSERRATRRAEREAFLSRIAEGEVRGCLVCRETDGGFTSEEHIIGESIGNTKLVLPNGVVCDRCNHGPLGALDGELAEFFPIKMRAITVDRPGVHGGVQRTINLGIPGTSDPLSHAVSA